MKTQFVELTPKEIFFGNAQKFQTAATGALINTTAAPKVIISPEPIPSYDSNLIAQQQIGFVLTDFLWKYRWEISIGSILVAGAIWYGNSVSQSEERKRNAQTGFSNQNL
jgi:hypothetical protein